MWFRSGLLQRPVWLAAIATLGVANSGTRVLAGAWTFEKGTGQIIASGEWTQNNPAPLSATLDPKTAKYVKRAIRAYGEYGVTDWLTLVFQPEFVNQHLSAPNPAGYGGAGYSRIGARTRVFRTDSLVISVEGQFALPAPSDHGSDGSLNRAQAGNTGPETDWRINAGYAFSILSKSAFIDVSAGYRTRGGRPADEWRGDVTLGVRPTPRWLMLIQLFNRISNGAGAPGFPYNSSSKLQVSAVYALTPSWSLQAGLVQTVMSHRSGYETGCIGGLWYKF